MPETATIDLSQDARAAFAWWDSLNLGTTRGTTVEDWEVTPYRDAFCFTRPSAHPNAWLIRDRVVMHFGFDSDTIESAYEMLPPSEVPASTVRTRFRGDVLAGGARPT